MQPLQAQQAPTPGIPLACMAMGLAKKCPGGAKKGMGMPAGMPGGMPAACAAAAAALSSPGATGACHRGGWEARPAHCERAQAARTAGIGMGICHSACVSKCEHLQPQGMGAGIMPP